MVAINGDDGGYAHWVWGFSSGANSKRGAVVERAMPPIPGPNVVVYTQGLVYASVCAPADMSIGDLLHEVNMVSPTGLERGWQLSPEEKFRSGEPNPCVCELDSMKVHRLLSC